MAKNFIQPGGTLDLTAPSGGVVTGLTYKIGTLIVVALVTKDQTLKFAAATEGVFEVPKAASQAWTEGAAVYWDDTNKVYTTTSSGNTKAGVAVVAVGSGAGEVLGIVRLNGIGT